MGCFSAEYQMLRKPNAIHAFNCTRRFLSDYWLRLVSPRIKIIEI